jgi:hypothetical protein
LPQENPARMNVVRRCHEGLEAGGEPVIRFELMTNGLQIGVRQNQPARIWAFFQARLPLR